MISFILGVGGLMALGTGLILATHGVGPVAMLLASIISVVMMGASAVLLGRRNRRKPERV